MLLRDYSFFILTIYGGIVVQADEVYSESDAAYDFKRYGDSLSFIWGELLNNGVLSINEGGVMVLSDGARLSPDLKPIIQYMVKKLNESVCLGILEISSEEGKLVVSTSESTKELENKLNTMVSVPTDDIGNGMQFDVSQKLSGLFYKEDISSIQSSEKHSFYSSISFFGF